MQKVANRLIGNRRIRAVVGGTEAGHRRMPASSDSIRGAARRRGSAPVAREEADGRLILAPVLVMTGMEARFHNQFPELAAGRQPSSAFS
jgi:hypothetical protein